MSSQPSGRGHRCTPTEKVHRRQLTRDTIMLQKAKPLSIESHLGMVGQNTGPFPVHPQGVLLMRTRVLSLAAALLLLNPPSTWPADLTKVERTIAKEPAYQTKSPRYCLLV